MPTAAHGAAQASRGMNPFAQSGPNPWPPSQHSRGESAGQHAWSRPRPAATVRSFMQAPAGANPNPPMLVQPDAGRRRQPLPPFAVQFARPESHRHPTSPHPWGIGRLTTPASGHSPLSARGFGETKPHRELVTSIGRRSSSERFSDNYPPGRG